jgi:hypothetical protein
MGCSSYDWINYPTYNWLFSDRTWTKWKKTLFLAGILASAALFIMPNSPTLWFAAGMLWIMDASINVSMDHFVPLLEIIFPKTTTKGLQCKVFFIGIGAYFASKLPLILHLGVQIQLLLVLFLIQSNTPLFWWNRIYSNCTLDCYHFKRISQKN